MYVDNVVWSLERYTHILTIIVNFNGHQYILYSNSSKGCLLTARFIGVAKF